MAAPNHKLLHSFLCLLALFLLAFALSSSFYSISSISPPLTPFSIYSDRFRLLPNNVLASDLNNSLLRNRPSDAPAAVADDKITKKEPDDSSRRVHEEKPNSEKAGLGGKSEGLLEEGDGEWKRKGIRREDDDDDDDDGFGRGEEMEEAMGGSEEEKEKESSGGWKESEESHIFSLKMPSSSSPSPTPLDNGHPLAHIINNSSSSSSSSSPPPSSTMNTSSSSSSKYDHQHSHPNPLDLPSPSCKGKLVYIYSLPPQFTEDLIDECGRLSGSWKPMCGNLNNHGYGPPMFNSSIPFPSNRTSSGILDPPYAWFKTEQFALEVIFHHRMLKSYPCLTQDPSLAQLFYIPFYAALDSALTIFSPQLHIRDRLIQRLIGWLGGNPAWNQFKDTRKHFMVLGRITWDFSRPLDATNGWGSSLFSQPELFGVTKLLIEKKSWSNDEMSIPYPTSFHPSSNRDVELWLGKVKASKRKLLFSFMGSKKRGDKWSKDLREELGKQCEDAGNKTCIQGICGSYSGAPDTIDCIQHPELVTALFLKTIFCLQPPGDSPTRKSLFDSLIAGCIPVFFSASSAYDQYTWHLPRNGSLYSILLDGDDVINGHLDIQATLANIAKDIPRLRQMQREVVSMLPHLVYASPHHNITNVSFRDAVDITIDNLLHELPLPQ